jgi:septal ring-binding cell division protein DamX
VEAVAEKTEPALVEKAEKPPAEAPVEKVGLKEPAAAKPAVKKPEKLKGVQGSEWIAAQPGSNFTLQLLASSERTAPEKFVAAHPQLKEPLARFEQQKGKSRLYVLAQGSYPSRTAAEAAARSLPAGIKPWIRDFAGIKKVMKAPVSTKQKVSTGKFKDTAWVWSQKPGHHTIQVAGASNEEALEAVMRGISLPGELAVVQTMRKGKPWYSLIYGSFATRKAAQGTVGRLPESLKKAGPWVRRFSAIQDEIGQAPGR